MKRKGGCLQILVMDRLPIFCFLMLMAATVSLLLGCDDHLIPEDVRKSEPSFKVWKEEVFYDDTGGIRVRTCYSHDSTFIWTKTCFPYDSACFISETRGRTDLYMETTQNDGRVFITFIINDGSNEPPAYRSLSFYPSGQLESEGIEANVIGHPSSNCFDSLTFKLHVDSLIYYRDGKRKVPITSLVKIGKWAYYYPNGKLRITQEYDSIYGRCRSLVQITKDGSSWTEEDKAIANGSWKIYSENGALKREQIWRKGRFINETVFD